MTDLTIELSEEMLTKLRERASAYGISPEDLVHAGINRILESPESEFKKAVDYILKKNEELYRRLA
jgi:hypothetical protein